MFDVVYTILTSIDRECVRFRNKCVWNSYENSL